MSAGRILTRTSLVLAGAALALWLAGPAGLVPPRIAVPVSAVLTGLAALSALAAGAGRSAEPGPPVPDPALSARAALGPALDGAEALAVCTVDRDGRIAYWNAGAVHLFGRTARDADGASAVGLVVPAEEDRAFRQEIEAVFSSGRGLPPRRTAVTDDHGRRVEAVRTLVPLRRYGRTVEIAIVFVEIRAASAGEKQARLFDAAPAALVGVDGEGRIEAANVRLSEWTGRRVDLLEGTEVARADIFPAPLREALEGVARRRRRAEDGPGALEFDETLLSVDGAPRPVHVVAAPRSGGGADVVLTDGTSRRDLLADLESARGSLVEARAAAADAIESSAREFRTSVEEVASAVRRARDESSGPVQRARAEVDLAETTREFLRRVDALQAGRRSGAPRALLVEDNEENRELLAHMLRSRGAEVVVAATGPEAAEAASRQPFSFVLLDLQMPEMDGYQVLRRLRALPGGATLPVVALTALTSEDVRRRCEAEGMNDFVTKPVTLARIRELVDRWGRAAPGASQGPKAER
ncbi:MAG TPA: response regulator [Thermoanaerobaculia bacterium]|nr:response regulator [Thermoanaerobaculia bacterium]